MTWDFDVTPLAAEHILRGIYVLPDLSKGWAVGEDGIMLHNSDPANSDIWLEDPPGDPVPNDAAFFDVWFADKDIGWLLAEHGIWYTVDAGVNWDPAILKDENDVNLDQMALDNLELYAMDLRLGLVDCIHDCDCSPPPLCTCPVDPTFGLACAEPGFIYRTIDGIIWKQVFDIQDYCDFHMDTPECAEANICDNPLVEPFFEPWDIEISDKPNDPLAIMVGGVGDICGLIFASNDWGCSWVQELHECDPNSTCNPDADL